MWNATRFSSLFLLFFSFSFHLRRTLSFPHSGKTMHQFNDEKKRGTKLLHHIRYKCFNFLCNFFLHFTIHFNNKRRQKKTQAHFYAEIWFFFCITCEHLFLCTQSIVNQQRNYDWAHRLLLHYNNKKETTPKKMSENKMKKKATNAGNKYYFTRFIDNFIKMVYFFTRTLFDTKRLIFFGIWSIWPRNIGNTEKIIL